MFIADKQLFPHKPILALKRAAPLDIVHTMLPDSAHRQARALSALLLLVSALSAASAFRLGESEGNSNIFRAQALFRSEILASDIPIEALLLEISREDFQGNSHSEFKVTPQGADPALFTASTTGPTRELSESRLREFKANLESTLKTLATKEVRTLKESLQAVPKPTPPAPKAASTPDESRRPTEAERLSRQQAVRLSLEIDDLKGYLSGEPEPVWMNERVDAGQYQKSQEAVSAAENKLRALRKDFRETSQQIVAQRKLLLQARENLKKNKLHLANVLLKSYQLELQELERETAARLTQKTKLASPPPATERQPLPSENWTETLSGNLEKDEQTISARVSILQVGETTVTEEIPHRQMLLLLWATSGVTLLLALHSWKGQESGNPPLSSATAIPTTLHQATYSPNNLPLKHTDPDPTLLRLLAALEKEHGGVGRFLIIGSNEQDARSSVSARLAYTLSSLGQNVRLIDLDLHQKRLSKRLGNSKTAGVIELASGSGPAEEFLASIAGTRIEFAPAGEGAPSSLPENSDGIEALLRLRNPESKLVIDADFTSPLHQIQNHVEAVICVTATQNKWSAKEQETLLQLKNQGLPIWGLLQGEDGFQPLS